MAVVCQRLPLMASLLATAAGLITSHDSTLQLLPTEEASGSSQLFGSGRRFPSSKTMDVRGHTVSGVSTRWTGKVVYAIFTSAIERYHEKLVAQLETWAEVPAREGRYVAVGGENYPQEWQSGDVVLRSECGDDMPSISCKEASLLAEGAARGADWLVVVGEDNYVHTGHVEETLKTRDPNEPVAFGLVGCGKGLYCQDSLEFETQGGFCGGGGYIISNGALRRLLDNGAQELHEVYDRSRAPNDMTTSCQLHKHGVQLRWQVGMSGHPIFSIQDLCEAASRSDLLTLHYLQPNVLRWLHMKVSGNESEAERLYSRAFDHGCARGMDNQFWINQYNYCLEMNAKSYN